MGNPEDKFQLHGSALTNVGKVRSHNEDNVHLWTGQNVMLAIVADGMGGAAAGEEASRIAVETIHNHLGIDPDTTDAVEDIPEQDLQAAIKAANVAIMQQAVDHPEQRGMGTTLTMVFINGDDARFAHVGDSRAYRVTRAGDIQQVTADHSFVQALLDAGHITEEQAETHPMSNVLYRALGQTPDVDVDTYEETLHPGEKLVLCSDGLTRHVRAKEIAATAMDFAAPNDISQQLVDLANERGGEDNISVIVIALEGDDALNTHNHHNANDDTTDSLAFPEREEATTQPPDDPPADVRASLEPRHYSYQTLIGGDERRTSPLVPPRHLLNGQPLFNIDPEGQDTRSPK